jgi:hypothetical protein
MDREKYAGNTISQVSNWGLPDCGRLQNTLQVCYESAFEPFLGVPHTQTTAKEHLMSPYMSVCHVSPMGMGNLHDGALSHNNLGSYYR